MIIYSIFEQLFNHIFFSIVSIVIINHLVTFLFDEILELSNSSKKGLIATFFCITGLLITRWIDSGHFPLNDLSESLLFLSWSLSIFHIMLFLFDFIKKNHFISVIIELGIILTQVFSSSYLLLDQNTALLLVPALQSHWLIMHVSMMLFSYASLLCGSLLSVALLVISFQQKLRFFFFKKYLLSIYTFYFEEIKKKMNGSRNFLQNTSFFSGNFYRCQLIQQLDYWSFRVIRFGFIFLNIGIIAGSIWANETWGSYWNWDPKETWSFITWTIFTIYLHTQTNTNWKGINSAIMALIGFVIIWICYFGVNFLEIGMHSYGSF
uniref:Cytochrome c biogenesis protein CcsA n=1 Tax=Viscum articulatum TaxID=50172 RepID=A0A7T1X5L0_9MAGN|nr:cytochrome c heme attachment protein [Viscum articulatum]QPP20691.1 cytochrome c heme attachment protein [Viscum articulatum]